MSQLVVGVDLGGTKISTGLVSESKLLETVTHPVSGQGSQQTVIDEVIAAIESVFSKHVKGIGIGVPSVVDVEKGIVYDVQNIASWKEVALKELLEKRFKVPVYVDNDANCFAVGEKYFGQAQGISSVVALVLGTGAAAGVITHGRLYHGYNCGAGEFGMMPYLDHHFEYYCSGNFFKVFYQSTGERLFRAAVSHDAEAKKAFNEFGNHLGNFLKAILYACDPELLVLGGSVSKAYQLFEPSMRESISSFAYHKTVDRLKIRVSKEPKIALLGAGALYYEFSHRHNP